MTTIPPDTENTARRHSPPGSVRLCSCSPTRGPARRAVSALAVDEELVWVTLVPSIPLGATRPASAGDLVDLSLQLSEDFAAALGAALESGFSDDDLVDAAARAVAGHLSDLPELPFIGEPFGGEEGTD